MAYPFRDKSKQIRKEGISLMIIGEAPNLIFTVGLTLLHANSCN
jgi:hypothetical protein